MLKDKQYILPPHRIVNKFVNKVARKQIKSWCWYGDLSYPSQVGLHKTFKGFKSGTGFFPTIQS